jgi:metal-sulfur cluster biosynthetic enzyme
MSEQITRETVLKKLENIEHPEIALSLVDLGMIIDVAVEKQMAKVAIALPMLNIPKAVIDAILQSITPSIKELGLTLQADFFEMTTEVKDNFFAAARAKWKGSI